MAMDDLTQAVYKKRQLVRKLTKSLLEQGLEYNSPAFNKRLLAILKDIGLVNHELTAIPEELKIRD